MAKKIFEIEMAIATFTGKTIETIKNKIRNYYFQYSEVTKTGFRPYLVVAKKGESGKDKGSYILYVCGCDGQRRNAYVRAKKEDAGIKLRKYIATKTPYKNCTWKGSQFFKDLDSASGSSRTKLGKDTNVNGDAGWNAPES